MNEAAARSVVCAQGNDGCIGLVVRVDILPENKSFTPDVRVTFAGSFTDFAQDGFCSEGMREDGSFSSACELTDFGLHVRGH
jgi:hypothetical protein